MALVLAARLARFQILDQEFTLPIPRVGRQPPDVQRLVAGGLTVPCIDPHRDEVVAVVKAHLITESAADHRRPVHRNRGGGEIPAPAPPALPGASEDYRPR